MEEHDNLVVATATRIFTDLSDAQTIAHAKDTSWKAPLWQTLAESGLPLSWVPDTLGGAGASLADGFAVLNAAGRFAVSVPLAETMLAGWLLGRAGIASPGGAMTIAPATPTGRIVLNDDGTLSGHVRKIPFASETETIALIATRQSGDGVVALVETASCRLTPHLTLAGDPCDTVELEQIQPLEMAPAPRGTDVTSLLLMGAVARSLQIAGALETMLDISVRYANERIAFEKKIAKFQAIQHNLAKLAGEAAAALAAASSAADAFAGGQALDEALFLEAAAAKIRCAEAAQKGAAIAHQVHGAIGFTREHPLHRFTMRALAWRDDFGNESYWAAELGRRVAARGADELWPLVASR